jgi:hypothetical protein
MNPSTIGVFNLALAFLGGEQLSSVQAPWEDSALGRLCAGNFGMVLDEALESHPWSFARARAVLARVSDPGRFDSLEPSGFGLEVPRQPAAPRIRVQGYALAADCLRPVGLAGGWPYVLEGRELLTEADPAELHYIRRVEDPGLWPPAFRVALAWGLAAVLATARVNDPQKQQLCLQRYHLALNEAMARDNQGQCPWTQQSRWAEERYGLK